MSIESKLSRLNRYLNILSQNSELSAARIEVLCLIREKNPITLRQLCDIQQVRMPTMSKLVDELQNDSLVIRAQSKDDARQRWIVPTQKGIQVLENAQQKRQEFWERKFKGVSSKDITRLEKSLDLLLEKLQPKSR
ncbi:MAG: MarR family transcriptional regulator [Kangiellaceae bacterium]|nr:MarR family transcriptional regulator [Kangiellaceae bacterium]MCW8999598.1 MarR family transcriptional regulator [Kangiellaceae bacterium]